MQINRTAIKTILISVPLILLGMACTVPRVSYSHPPVKSDSLCFEALLESKEIAVLPESLFGGFHYDDTVIKKINLHDSAELFVGRDANYLITLSDLKFEPNQLGLSTLKLLFLHIHSPSMALIDSTHIGKGANFILCYDIEDNFYQFKLFYRKSWLRSNN